MKILHLVLKKKWFDMIESGKKPEEYREIKPYWMNRLIAKGDPAKWTKKDKDGFQWQEYTMVKFYDGYKKGRRDMTFDLLNISVGKAVPEWSDNWVGDVFVIRLGEKLPF